MRYSRVEGTGMTDIKSSSIRKMLRGWLLSSAFAFSLPGFLHADSASSGGTDQVRAVIDGEEIPVYTFHPKGCASPSILMVFHGSSRAAKSYLKSSREIAQRGCFVVYAPLFDKKRFPGWSYQRGGLVRDGKLLPEDDWTVEMVGDLLEWAKKQEGKPNADVYLFGHSAGGQFLSRVAAYALPEDVDRIVIANPSTYVLPTVDEKVPYGYGGLSSEEQDKWMKAYLAAPITIFLGSDDVGSKELTMTKQAQEQGDNRLDRGRKTFAEAKKIAEDHGWPFNWKLVMADGIAHSGRGMLQSDAAFQALGF